MTKINIIRIVSVLILLTICSCTKECKEWYSGVDLRGVTKNSNSNREINGWYETEYLGNELNFWIVYAYSSDGYEECKSKTRIHELIKSDTKITCSGRLIIGNDTLISNTNLYNYFKLIGLGEGNDILQYNSTTYPFPKFETPTNNFKVEIPLTDGKTISGTKLISVN